MLLDNVLALTTIATAGPGLVAVALPWDGPKFARLGLIFFAGVTLSLGLFAAIALIPFFAGIQHPTLLRMMEATLTIAGIALLFPNIGKGKTALPSPGHSRGLLIVLVLGILTSVTRFILQTRRFPDGGWDAWAIWNLRARFISFNSPRVFDPAFSHADYPPLLPMLIARIWWLTGGMSLIVPQVLAAIFAALCCGILLFGVRWFAGRNAGLLAVIVLLGTPDFITHAADQYADVMLACLFLTACLFIAIALGETGRSSVAMLALGGMTASLATLTKNEGGVQFVSLFGALIAGSFFLPSHLVLMGRRLIWFGLGACPLLLILLVFKVHFAPSNDFVSANPAFEVAHAAASGDTGIVATTPTLSRRMTDPHRYRMVIGAVLNRLVKIDRWNLFLLGALVALLVKPANNRFRAARIAIGSALIAVNLCLAAAYILTPHDLAWHINTSLDRLILQTWPTLLLLSFVRLAP